MGALTTCTHGFFSVEGVSGHTADKAVAAKERLEQFYSNLVVEQEDREKRWQHVGFTAILSALASGVASI